MAERLEAYLDGAHVGSIEQSASGSLTFAYDDDYRSSVSATPLSLSLPLSRGLHKNRPTRAFLQGLLPDSDARLSELARDFGVSARNPFALLTHMGRDAAGAVQLLPPDVASGDAATRHGDVDVLDDDTFADMIADVIANRDTWGRRDIANVRWSLPGAQPKLALFRMPDGGWAVPRDATPTTHIIKPAVPPYSDHHLNEHLTMAAARHLGLDVADGFVLNTVRGDAAFVSVRYDRRQENGSWVRLHQEDLCQALGLLPDKKYQGDGGPGVAQIAQLFDSLPHHEDGRRSAERFFDALAFNVAAVGTDAHAKNYSLTLRGDRAALAPLYDLGSHAPYPSRGGAPLRLAMSLEGEYRIDAVGVNALENTGVRLRIDRDRARSRAVEITAGIVDAFQVAATEARRTFGPHAFIDRMVASIETHAAQRGWYEKPTIIPL